MLQLVSEAKNVLSMTDGAAGMSHAGPFPHVTQNVLQFKQLLYIGGALCGTALAVAAYSGAILNNQVLIASGSILLLTNTLAYVDTRRLVYLPTLAECVNKLTVRVMKLYELRNLFEKSGDELKAENDELKKNIADTKKAFDIGNRALSKNIQELNTSTKKLGDAEKKIHALEFIFNQLKETTSSFSTDVLELANQHGNLQKSVSDLGVQVDHFDGENKEFDVLVKNFDSENAEIVNETRKFALLNGTLKGQIELLKELYLQVKKENAALSTNISAIQIQTDKALQASENIKPIQKKAEDREKALEKVLGRLQELHELNELLPLLKALKKGEIDSLIAALRAKKQ